MGRKSNNIDPVSPAERKERLEAIEAALLRASTERQNSEWISSASKHIFNYAEFCKKQSLPNHLETDSDVSKREIEEIVKRSKKLLDSLESSSMTTIKAINSSDFISYHDVEKPFEDRSVEKFIPKLRLVLFSAKDALQSHAFIDFSSDKRPSGKVLRSERLFAVRIAFIYREITGESPTRRVSVVGHKIYGPFLVLLEEVFEAVRFTRENARTVLKDAIKEYGRLSQKKPAIVHFTAVSQIDLMRAPLTPHADHRSPTDVRAANAPPPRGGRGCWPEPRNDLRHDRRGWFSKASPHRQPRRRLAGRRHYRLAE